MNKEILKYYKENIELVNKGVCKMIDGMTTEEHQKNMSEAWMHFMHYFCENEGLELKTEWENGKNGGIFRLTCCYWFIGKIANYLIAVKWIVSVLNFSIGK